MFCPKCGKQLADTAKFCTGCGAALKPSSPPAPQPTPPVADPQPPQVPSEPAAPVAQAPAGTPKKKLKPVVLLSIAAAVVLVVIAGVFGVRAFLSHKAYQDQMTQAQESMAEEDFKSAAASFKAALAVKPDDKDASLGLAEAYLLQGDSTKAARTCKTILEDDPDNETALQHLGTAYLDLGEYDQAQEPLEHLLELAPENASALSLLGSVYYHQGRYDLAKEKYQAALALSPDNEEAYESLAAIYYTDGDLDKAAENYRALLDLDPQHANAALSLAELYLQQSSFDQASQLLEGLSLSPDDVFYSRYQALLEVVRLQPKLVSLDDSGFPRIAVTFSVQGDQYLDPGQLTVTENGQSREVYDLQQKGGNWVLTYDTLPPSGAGEDRTVSVVLTFNGYTFPLEEHYTPLYGPAIVESFLGGEFWSMDGDDGYLTLSRWGSSMVTVGWNGPEWGTNIVDFDPAYMTGNEFRLDGNLGHYSWNDGLSPTGYLRFLPKESSPYGLDTIYLYYSSYSQPETYARLDGGSALPNGAAGDYLLPTDTMYISEADLASLTQEQVVLARNEIYARYGYDFQAENIRSYFNSKSWYTPDPNVNASTFGTAQMNDFERANLEVIQNYEIARGWKQ